jgi:hypothetical protein
MAACRISRRFLEHFMRSERHSTFPSSSHEFSGITWPLIFCLLVAGSVTVAHAGIVLIGQDRFTDIVSDDGRDTHQAAADFAPFNSNIELNGLGAFQQSTLTVTPDGKGAEFKALLSSTGGLGVPDSHFGVDFAITGGPVPYTVTYSSLTASEAGPSAGPTAGNAGRRTIRARGRCEFRGDDHAGPSNRYVRSPAAIGALGHFSVLTHRAADNSHLRGASRP